MAHDLTVGQRFVDNGCSPVIDTNYDTTGTVSLTTIAHLKPSMLQDLFRPGGLFADLDAWFVHSIEMKACGTRTYGWYDWIMANAPTAGLFTQAYRNAIRPGTKVVKGDGLLEPFIKGRQKTVANRDHWVVENSIRIADYTPATAGAALGTMTSGPLAATTGGTAVLRVTSRHGIPMNANWFRPREVLYVFTTTLSKVQQGNWRVIDAAVNTSLTYIDVLVVSENAGTSAAFFNFATTGASAKKGVMIPGINNVSDYESWCTNLPNIDTRKMVPFWWQVFRQTRRVSAEYLAVFKRLMQSNKAFKEFGDMDMAERNAQDELESQKRFVNAFFFQKPLSTNQTLENWESLEAINTVTEVDIKPGLGGKLQARRANFVGVREQLYQCGRVKDLQKNKLALNEFWELNYALYRARTSAGRRVTRIDWHTNARYRDMVYQGMLAYYKARYSDSIRYIVELGKSDTDQLGFIWDVYRVGHPVAVEIVVISSEFFDDWYDEHNALGQPEVGNMMLALDIGKPGPQGGTIYYAALAGNRKQYSTARIEELARFDATFRCVMATTSEDVTLTSETGAVIVECPLDSLWLENIAMDIPVITGDTSSATDAY